MTAPQACGLLPAAFAIVRNGLGRVLLVRRTGDGYWELPGGRVEVGESASAAVPIHTSAASAEVFAH